MEPTPPEHLDAVQKTNGPEEWEQFVRSYAPVIFDWCRRNGLQEEDSADVTQDVFTRLFEKLPAFQNDPQKSFRAWLKTLAANLWRDRCKLRATRPLATAWTDLNALPGREDAEAAEEREFRDRLMARAMNVMKHDFQPTTWQAFWEHGIQRRPAKEVAEETGLSVTSVYGAKFRVLTRLKEAIEGMDQG